jgi:hypothetical protein
MYYTKRNKKTHTLGLAQRLFRDTRRVLFTNYRADHLMGALPVYGVSHRRTSRVRCVTHDFPCVSRDIAKQI